MPVAAGGVTAITDLTSTVLDSPDFSFLDSWDSRKDSSFFPRINGADDEALRIDREGRAKLRGGIEAVEGVQELLQDAQLELSESKGRFSNSISVFHKDGEISVVAVPVTSVTRRAIGGFLLAHDLWGVENAELFVEGLRNLGELVPSTEGYLKWRWWPVNKETRELNARSAAQLLLAVTNPGDRNIQIIADLMEERAQLSSGLREPELNDWLQAITKLESLKELGTGVKVVTLSVDQVVSVTEVLAKLQAAFGRQDELRQDLKDELGRLIENRTAAHLDTLTLEDFAKKVKGQGFQLRLLLSRFNEYAPTYLDGNDQIPTVGAALRLYANARACFDTESLKFAVKLLNGYAADQKLLQGYPRLTDSDEHFNRFLVKSYKLYRDQQRPFPARHRFEELYKLLQDSPEQMHFVARNEEDVTRLIGSMDVYTDATRVDKIVEPYEEPTLAEAKSFFRENPAGYQAMLSSLGFNALTLEQISGFLAPEVTAAIRDIDVDTEGMKSPLRSYQTFGIQYALHQRRVILGDEMGLGKTVTGLGLITHLFNGGAKRFLVIVPLAVLENWRREILKHTSFESYVLYGENLESELESWATNGGLALATFESMQKVNALHQTASIKNVDLTIVDEAHYLKNPDTKRSAGVLPWVRSSDRALLMTGTPLENKLEEFEQLISYVQPNLPMPKNKAIYTAFRRAIAPAYLRRNQIDVLQELPDLQDTEEFIELSPADIEYYRRALQAGDWNLARRAKMLAGKKSSTVQRIEDIVEEAMANDDKVLIFSFYREVIDVLRTVLKDDDPYIPITGDLSSAERQDQVDRFTRSEKPGVLLAQIKAGGTGLNIQAASIVLIIEPQTKPSLEDQAIRRAYRMGQTKNVRVIRFRAKNTIDDRWVAMLNEKRKLFNATAGVSDVHAFDEAVSSQQSSVFADEKKAWGVE